MVQHILLHQSQSPECGCAAPADVHPARILLHTGQQWMLVVRSSQAQEREGSTWEQPHGLEPLQDAAPGLVFVLHPAVVAKSPCPQHFLRGLASWLFIAVEAAVWIWKVQLTPSNDRREIWMKKGGKGFLLPESSFRRHSSRDAGVLSALQFLVLHMVEWAWSTSSVALLRWEP